MHQSYSKLILFTSAVAFAWLLFSNTDVVAQTPSIFQRRDHQMANLAADIKATRPGDLLYITIQERSDVANTAQRLLSKKNNASSSGEGDYTVGGGGGTAAGNLGFTQDSEANRQFNADAQFKSKRGFTDRFTVRVVDNLPNGNLLISGSRDISLEGDSFRLILTGVVRAVDVTATNTISSGQVSDLTIRYESHGPQGAEQNFVNQGWLAKKVNRWWPY